MAFTPSSSIAPASVAIIGTVTADVTDRAARLLGHVTVDNASLAVTGPMTDAQFAAHLPLAVTGPLTDAELRASPVDVTADEWPLPDGAATDAMLGDVLAVERGAADALGLVANALTDVDPTSLGDE